MLDIKETIRLNPELLSTRARTRAFFADVFYDDKAKINVLMNAYDIGIIDELKAPDSFTKSRVIISIATEYAVKEEKAKEAFEIWDSILSPDVIAAIKILETKEKTVEAKSLQAFLDANNFEEDLSDFSDLEFQKDDYETYYVNPAIPQGDKRIYVPCGYCNTDSGFFIYGIVKQNTCVHPYGSVYALVYNFLTRNSKMTECDLPDFIKAQNTLFSLNFRNIYRLAIIILQLIKNNYITDNSLALNYSGIDNDLKYAVFLLNEYTDMFCSIIGIPAMVLHITNSPDGIQISLNEEKGIFVKNNIEFSSNAREIWHGEKINYQIDINNAKTREALKRLLTAISSFDSFKEGQLSALASMLNSRKHAVCIMPTGSGKSLIYYLASFLQPMPIFVIAPTDILIRDQIRNLRRFHRIDNVAHLQLTGENSFKDYSIQCSINFLTPMTFQNRNLLAAFRLINNGEKRIGLTKSDAQFRTVKISSGSLAAYIVLDEIHCLSNWGHDFRPEYLMLSEYLNHYLDQINLWGFTATANYTVVEDIQKQLGIQEDSIFSPISFDKYNVTYDYRCVKTIDDMYGSLKSVVSRYISRGERTLVFVKDEKTAIKAADFIGNEADVFMSDNPESYYQFVEGKCSVLVATDELGIGINLPNVVNVVNFGLPLSKESYVQEIGRAGREFGIVKSVVIYLEPNEQNIPYLLLRRDTSIADLLLSLQEINNDYADVYHRITNNCPTEDTMIDRIMSFYSSLNSMHRTIFTKSYGFENVNDAKQLLYMLYVCGYIKDWYAYSVSNDEKELNILIDICSTNDKNVGSNSKVIFMRMRNRIIEYFNRLGNNREMIVKVNRAKNQEEIITLYVQWYYRRFLYLHKEQFIDLFEFIQHNSKSDSASVAEEIQDYFFLPFAKIKLEETTLAEMSLLEIGRKGITGISRSSMANIERINSNNYSYKNDFLLFCSHLRVDSVFEESRLVRVLDNITANEASVIFEILVSAYGATDIFIRLELVRFIERFGSRFDCSIMNYLDEVFSVNEKDEIYYGIMARKLNDEFIR